MIRKGRLARLLGALRRDESGATAIEYGLIAALIFVTAISAMALMGGNATERIGAAFERIAAALEGSAD